MGAQRQRPTVSLTLCRARSPRRPENSHLRKDAAQPQKFAIHGNLGQTNVSIVSKLANLSSVGLVSRFSPGDERVHRQIKGVAVQTNLTNTSRVSNAHRGAPRHGSMGGLVNCGSPRLCRPLSEPLGIALEVAVRISCTCRRSRHGPGNTCRPARVIAK